MSKQFPVVAMESVVRRIFQVRGQKVMLDADLAELYGVETRILVQAVKRNLDRFPSDFMFQLTAQEWDDLRSQSVIPKKRGGRRYSPYAFTEHGALMLSAVLNSSRASEISTHVVRAFIWLRQMVPAQQEISLRLAELEARLGEHDQALAQIIEAIRTLMEPPDPRPEKRPIGF